MTTSDPQDTSKRTWKSAVNIQPQEVIHFILMLVGILGKQVYDGLVINGGFAFSAKRFAVSIIISPLFYTLVYAQLKAREKDNVTLISATLAFQNGFFWETILSGINTGT